MHFVFENICRKRVRRQMTIWERLKSRVCWARLWGSVWRPPDMNMKLRHKKHFWGWATKPKCCRKRDLSFTEGMTIHIPSLSLSLNCCLCRQPHLGSAFWVIFLRSSLSACAETCECWMQSETIPSAFLLPTLSSNRWLYRCSSTGETIRESISVQNNCLFALLRILMWSLPFEISEVVKWVRHSRLFILIFMALSVFQTGVS